MGFYPFDRFGIQAQTLVFFGNRDAQFARFHVFGNLFQIGFQTACIGYFAQEAAICPVLILFGFVIVDGAGFDQFFRFC